MLSGCSQNACTVLGLVKSFSSGVAFAEVADVVKWTITREKRVYTATVAPLLSRGLSPDPEAHRAKKAVVYTISLGKQLWCIPLGKLGERAYTISPERVYTIEVPDLREKEGFHGGGVYFYLPCINPKNVAIGTKCHFTPPSRPPPPYF